MDCGPTHSACQEFNLAYVIASTITRRGNHLLASAAKASNSRQTTPPVGRVMYRILEREGETRERLDQVVHPAYTKPELLATGPNQLWRALVQTRRVD